jgi:hypothetical protein
MAESSPDKYVYENKIAERLGGKRNSNWLCQLRQVFLCLKRKRPERSNPILSHSTEKRGRQLRRGPERGSRAPDINRNSALRAARQMLRGILFFRYRTLYSGELRKGAANWGGLTFFLSGFLSHDLGVSVSLIGNHDPAPAEIC